MWVCKYHTPEWNFLEIPPVKVNISDTFMRLLDQLFWGRYAVYMCMMCLKVMVFLFTFFSSFSQASPSCGPCDSCVRRCKAYVDDIINLVCIDNATRHMVKMSNFHLSMITEFWQQERLIRTSRKTFNQEDLRLLFFKRTWQKSLGAHYTRYQLFI